MVAHGLFKNTHRGEPLSFGSHLVKPSDLFGSVKRSLSRKTKCQCKHHQQKLLQKQEEQRQHLKKQLQQRGDRRHLEALNRYTKRVLLTGSEEIGDIDSLDGQLPTGLRSFNPDPSGAANFKAESLQIAPASGSASFGVGFMDPIGPSNTYHKGHGTKSKKHRKSNRESTIYHSDEESGAIYEERISIPGPSQSTNLDLISEKSSGNNDFGKKSEHHPGPPTPPPIP
eukprot:maker-scaffold139_size317827-snap-gene-2.22 protein:Tk05022 transcript:maker-scaffold139_size317827-snap-gene-2.22-mRNA-1 annotation:"coiled-coil domain-containing protein kiaa1407 homolog isoform x1"